MAGLPQFVITSSLDDLNKERKNKVTKPPAPKDLSFLLRLLNSMKRSISIHALTIVANKSALVIVVLFPVIVGSSLGKAAFGEVLELDIDNATVGVGAPTQSQVFKN